MRLALMIHWFLLYHLIHYFSKLIISKWLFPHCDHLWLQPENNAIWLQSGRSCLLKWKKYKGRSATFNKCCFGCELSYRCKWWECIQGVVVRLLSGYTGSSGAAAASIEPKWKKKIWNWKKDRNNMCAPRQVLQIKGAYCQNDCKQPLIVFVLCSHWHSYC